MATLAFGPLAWGQEEPPPGAPATAEAVADLQPPGFWEGGGLRIGENTILHPGVTLAGSYQSNVFFQDPKDGPAGPISSPLMRIGVNANWASITPGRMEIEAPGSGPAPQRFRFHVDLGLEWYQYISSNPDVTAQNDLGIQFLGAVTFNPEGQLTLDISDGFVRNVTPGQSLREDADRDRNELNATLHYKPGGGALDMFAGYHFVIDVFEESILHYENRFTHQGSLGVTWQWLPHTALTLQTSLATVNPNNSDFKSSSMPFRVTLSASSLLTPVIGAIVMGGYGNGFYESGENVSTWLAMAELRYAIGPTLRTAIGYSHDFADALIGNFYVDHNIYARATAQFGSRWQARIKGEIRFRNYGGIQDTTDLTFCGNASCPKTREDTLPRLEVGTDYSLTPWFLIGVSYIFQNDTTDFYVQSNSNPLARDYGAFTWHEVDLRLNAKW